MPQTPPPSIFNDVIGPVMRGPSSSHCAAAVRIGRIVRDLMDGDLTAVHIQFDPNGSLATTHESQGSDMGLFGGLLGWEATDERLADSPKAIRQQGINIQIEITPIGAALNGAAHPNTYKITAANRRETHTLTALSTGGGIIEIIEIDGVPLQMAGDYYETLLYWDVNPTIEPAQLENRIEAEEIRFLTGPAAQWIEIKTRTPLNPNLLADWQAEFQPTAIKQIAPVLPVLSRRDVRVPFITCTEMLAFNQAKNLKLWQLAAAYESARGGISQDEVLAKMEAIIAIMQAAIQTGLAGTDYQDRILGYQSGQFQSQMAQNRLIDGGVLNRIILYTTALMETKSSMGLIVAAPTAGACGGLPGALIGAAEALGKSQLEMAQAMLAGGLIGVFIAAHATFAAEVGGCQAECGAGSGMAAAALVNLAGGSTRQAVVAASLALQNILGMICDPVANRVEVPCLGKNILAASNALACANMALAGYDPVIPLDQVIATMDTVGKMIPAELRCTALGGLSITPASIRIAEKLNPNSYPEPREFPKR